MKYIYILLVMLSAIYPQDEKRIDIKTIAKIVLDIKNLKKDNADLQQKIKKLKEEINLLQKNNKNTTKKSTYNKENIYLVPLAIEQNTYIESHIPDIKRVPWQQWQQQKSHICNLFLLQNKNTKEENIILFEILEDIDNVFMVLKQKNIPFGPLIIYPKIPLKTIQFNISKTSIKIDNIEYNYEFHTKDNPIDSELIDKYISLSGRHYYTITLPPKTTKIRVVLGYSFKDFPDNQNINRISISTLKNIDINKLLEHLDKVYHNDPDNFLRTISKFTNFSNKKKLENCTKKDLQNFQIYLETKLNKFPDIKKTIEFIEKIVQIK